LTGSARRDNTAGSSEKDIAGWTGARADGFVPCHTILAFYARNSVPVLTVFALA
jgi:hypothetical protein